MWHQNISIKALFNRPQFLLHVSQSPIKQDSNKWTNLQIGALSIVEAKKRFEFLEAFSGTVEAHLRYFKQVKALIGFKFFLALHVICY